MRPGTSRKLHKPWSGPFKVIKKLLEVNYRIQKLKNRRNRVVVHFDRLKRFTARLNLEEVSTAGPGQTDEPSNQLQSSTNIGDNLELCEADDDELSPTNNRCYPTRSCHPHCGCKIMFLIEATQDESFRKGGYVTDWNYCTHVTMHTPLYCSLT